jgi:hypothetical protein
MKTLYKVIRVVVHDVIDESSFTVFFDHGKYKKYLGIIETVRMSNSEMYFIVDYKEV